MTRPALLLAALAASAATSNAALPKPCANNGMKAKGILSGTTNVTIPVTGANSVTMDRTFTVFVPWGNGANECFEPGPPSTPRPLVMNWHGCNNHKPLIDYHLDISRMNEVAADNAWFTFHPVGTKFLHTSTTAHYGWNALGCCAGCADAKADDYAFADAMLAWADENLCYDSSRVFTTGFSNGAYMSNSLACRTPAGRKFAGASANAGSLSRSELKACANPALGALPVISFHSKTDTYVSYNGNLLNAGQLDIAAMFRERAGCDGSEVEEITFNTSTTTCIRRTCASTGVAIENCALENLNHCWIGGRGGGYNYDGNCRARATDIDATRAMFAFWSEQTNIQNPPY